MRGTRSTLTGLLYRVSYDGGMSVGIVGTGLAGLRTAAELRERGYEGEIIAWDAEGRAPYDRPPLSKELFGEYLHPLDDDGLGNFAELAVQVVSVRVSSVMPDGDAWVVESGEGAECVDTVVIATGTAPRASIPGAWVLYSADDAAVLRELIVPGAAVHIVGAGWIGCEVASAAVARGAIVTLWEASDHILDRTFHGSVDDLWVDWFAEAGVAVHRGTSYPGHELSPDVLVQATGAGPVLDAVSMGVRSARGALTTNLSGCVLDEDFSPIPGLYAVGDCADALMDSGAYRAGGHWTGVLGSAARAAAAITHTEAPRFLEPPEVFSTQFGHEITLVGEVPADVTPRHSVTAGGQTLTWDLDGELVAMLGVDAPREVSRARRQLRITR